MSDRALILTLSNMAKKKIIVTGGAGFIGSHVVDRLVDSNWDVHVIDNLYTGKKSFVNPKATLHKRDVRNSSAQRVVAKVRPRCLIHLAAQVDLRKSVREPSLDADVNLVGGLKMVEACRDAKVRHMVFASSAAVYGGVKKLPAKETYPSLPVSPYGLAKWTFEHYLRIAEDIAGIKSASLRFSNVYGPRQTVHGEAGVVAIFLTRLLSGKPCVINGDGKQTRDYIFVEDVARMVVEAAENQIAGVYNVSTGMQTTVNKIYGELSGVLGIKRKARHGKPKAGEDRKIALDPSKAKRATGWEAEVSLQEGLGLTADWARDVYETGKPLR